MNPPSRSMRMRLASTFVALAVTMAVTPAGAQTPPVRLAAATDCPRNVNCIGGLRPAAVRAMRKRRIDVWPGYSGSLLGYLGGRDLRSALRRIGAAPLRRSPAQDRNGFAMKRDVARSLGINKLSDLARYWPAVAARASARARAAADPHQPE